MYYYIFFQGKGYPDINTRLFVKQLSCKLKIQILTLVDANPFGIEIMCIYRYGSNVRNYLIIKCNIIIKLFFFFE